MFFFPPLVFMHTLRFKRTEDKQWSLTVQLHGGTYEQASDEEDRLNFGMYLWPSAALLSRFLLCAPQTVAGKRVLELGAGTGLSGIVAAGLCSPACVTLTDTAGAVLANLRKNVAANLEAFGAVPVVATELSWDRAPRVIATAAPGAWSFDVVLAADCLYAESHMGDFFATLAALALQNPRLVCYLTYQERCATLCIKPHLDFWGLEAEEIPTQDLASLLAGVIDDQEIDPTVTLRLIKITMIKKNNVNDN